MKNYKDLEVLKYYTILHPNFIENFSLDKQKEVFLVKENPYKYATKRMLKGLLGSVKNSVLNKIAPENLNYQPLNDLQLASDAKHFIEGWKNQFNITDMNAPLQSIYLKVEKFVCQH